MVVIELKSDYMRIMKDIEEHNLASAFGIIEVYAQEGLMKSVFKLSCEEAKAITNLFFEKYLEEYREAHKIPNDSF